MLNYYEILGIEKDATQEQIKTAYRSLSKKYHPDLNDASNAASFFRLLQEAYSVLSDDAKRSNYDQSNFAETEEQGNPKQSQTVEVRHYHYYSNPEPEPEGSPMSGWTWLIFLGLLAFSAYMWYGLLKYSSFTYDPKELPETLSIILPLLCNILLTAYISQKSASFYGSFLASIFLSCLIAFGAYQIYRKLYDPTDDTGIWTMLFVMLIVHFLPCLLTVAITRIVLWVKRRKESEQ